MTAGEESIAMKRATEIADKIVPEYRTTSRSYSCTGTVAKKWQAAWDGAIEALGHDHQLYRTPSRGPA